MLHNLKECFPQEVALTRGNYKLFFHEVATWAPEGSSGDLVKWWPRLSSQATGVVDKNQHVEKSSLSQADKAQSFQKHLIWADFIIKNYSQKMFIDKFQFFRIPSATEMPYRVTVLKVWHNENLVKPCFSRVTENVSESFNNLYLTGYYQVYRW